jgi:thymidine phosphorylase
LLFGNAVLDAIETKKRGGELSGSVIKELVEGYSSGEVPDYQMSALLMAIFIQGMGYQETLTLTEAMADSGKRYSFPCCVDKHSTGGVGDKISLTSLPIVAACGAPVAKLSGLAIVEAGDLTPADKAIYALRDTTGTVDSLPLVGFSIVSKKVATGAGHLLYDVKSGSGAFMKTIEEARELAELLVRLSKSLGIEASALITNMDEPLGVAVGNVLEVRESVRFLRDEPSAADLSEVTRIVAVRLLELKGIPEPRSAVEKAISSGAAYEKFREFVTAQDGDTRALENLPVTDVVQEVGAPQTGYVTQIEALGVGRAALLLGAGRLKKGDEVDPGVGVEVLIKSGDEVEEGQPVVRLYGGRNVEKAVELVLEALKISDTPDEHPPAILGSLQ